MPRKKKTWQMGPSQMSLADDYGMSQKSTRGTLPLNRPRLTILLFGFLRCSNVSAGRSPRFSWSEFLQKALPEALERATLEDVRFREGLPLRALSALGEQFLGGRCVNTMWIQDDMFRFLCLPLTHI